MKLNRFMVLTPIFVLFGLGVLLRSTNVKSNLKSATCNASNLSGSFINETLATFDGNSVVVPGMRLANLNIDATVLGVASLDERWIEVDLSEQKLRAWDGNELFLETMVSSGLAHTPTPIGEFRIWIKLRATKMEGGKGAYYYYLPNVPFVMFFGNEEVPNWRGYGLHGTYWHDDFGNQRSHGCVNLPTTVAEKLYYWTGPVLSEGKSVVYSDEENLGTRIIIHE